MILLLPLLQLQTLRYAYLEYFTYDINILYHTYEFRCDVSRGDNNNNSSGAEDAQQHACKHNQNIVIINTMNDEYQCFGNVMSAPTANNALLWIPWINIKCANLSQV